MKLLQLIFATIFVQLCYPAALPLESDELSVETSFTLDGSADNSTEIDDFNPQDFDLVICSPACEHTMLLPCSAEGRCDAGETCCLDTCLGAPICRKSTSGWGRTLVNAPSDVVEQTEIEKKSELFLKRTKVDNDEELSKRNVQYDAEGYAISPEEYHRKFPQGPTEDAEVETDAEDDDNRRDIYATRDYTTELPFHDDDDDTSDLFELRIKRKAQDETGGFPVIPVHTYDISTARKKLEEVFEHFRNKNLRADDDDRDDDDNDNEEDHDDDDENEDVADAYAAANADAGIMNNESDTFLESDLSIFPTVEEEVAPVIDELTTNSNDSDILKRNTEVEDTLMLDIEENITELPDTNDTENARRPTIIFLRKIPADESTDGEQITRGIVGPISLSDLLSSSDSAAAAAAADTPISETVDTSLLAGPYNDASIGDNVQLSE